MRLDAGGRPTIQNESKPTAITEMSTHSMLNIYVGRSTASRRLDLFDAIERDREAALGGGYVEFIPIDTFHTTLHPVVVGQLDEIILSANGMSWRTLEPTIPFLNA